MKKISIIVISIISILITGVVLTTIHSEDNSDTSIFQTVSLKIRSIEQSVTATGIIKPKTGAEVKVGAQVSGIVKKLYVSIGTKVKKGQLLAELEPTSYQAKVDMANAQKDIAETDKKYAQLELNRAQSLIKTSSISTQQLELAEKQYDLTVSRLNQAKADLDYANLQLSYTRITSPIDGVVSSVSTQEGETVAASFTSPTFVTIIDLNRLELWAYIDETDIGRITKEQPVTFTVDTYPGEEFTGRVEAIYPKAEIQNNVVNYVTVINIEKKDGKVIRPEMTASVRIINGKKEKILTVPKNLIKKEDGKTFVYVLNNKKPEKRFIVTGISDKKFYEVVSGISESEKIVAGEVQSE